MPVVLLHAWRSRHERQPQTTATGKVQFNGTVAKLSNNRSLGAVIINQLRLPAAISLCEFAAVT
jgi:hypothetical protein